MKTFKNKITGTERSLEYCCTFYLFLKIIIEWINLQHNLQHNLVIKHTAWKQYLIQNCIKFFFNAYLVLFWLLYQPKWTCLCIYFSITVLSRWSITGHPICCYVLKNSLGASPNQCVNFLNSHASFFSLGHRYIFYEI